jgi:hypothetical protein
MQPEFLTLMQLLTKQRIIANGLGQLLFEELWPTYSRARPDAVLLEGLFAPKLVELRRLLADLVIAQGRKVVVFSQWRRMLRLAEWSVRDVLGDEGVRAAFFTVAEKQAQRTRSVVDFHDDPRVRVMFLSDAGGVGLNLQKAASACINLELPWNPAVLEQRIGRVYRLGQKRPIDIYNLVSENSIEARIAGLVGSKQALFSGLFDGTSDEIRFDTAASFLTRVERMVEPAQLSDAPLPDAVGATPELEGGEEETAQEAAHLSIEDASLDDPLPQVPMRMSASAPDSRVTSGTTNDVRVEASVAADEVAQGEVVVGSVYGGRNPVAALFDLVRVERTGDGGIRIEAPAQAAGSLVALFEGMAKLLAGGVESEQSGARNG